jgi:hypothetical protein
VGEYRTAAKQLALQFADRFAKFGQSQGDTVALAFGYPKGSSMQSAQLTKVASGMTLPQADVDLAMSHTVQRGILMAACRAAGAPDDTAKGESVLKGAAPGILDGHGGVAVQTFTDIRPLEGRRA